MDKVPNDGNMYMIRCRHVIPDLNMYMYVYMYLHMPQTWQATRPDMGVHVCVFASV